MGAANQKNRQESTSSLQPFVESMDPSIAISQCLVFAQQYQQLDSCYVMNNMTSLSTPMTLNMRYQDPEIESLFQQECSNAVFQFELESICQDERFKEKVDQAEIKEVNISKILRQLHSDQYVEVNNDMEISFQTSNDGREKLKFLQQEPKYTPYDQSNIRYQSPDLSVESSQGSFSEHKEVLSQVQSDIQSLKQKIHSCMSPSYQQESNCSLQQIIEESQLFSPRYQELLKKQSTQSLQPKLVKNQTQSSSQTIHNSSFGSNEQQPISIKINLNHLKLK